MPLRVIARHCAARDAKPRPGWLDKADFLRRIMTEVPARDVTLVFDSASGEEPGYVARAAEAGTTVVRDALGSDLYSLARATQVALATCADDDIVYFVEDVYLHRPGWRRVLEEAFEHGVADYVTLYDHPDKYELEQYADLRSRVTVTPSAHWRTVPSTTNTWATRARTLRRDLEVHRRFLQPHLGHCIDHEKFLALWAAGASLASCIPAMSTHAQLGCLAPWGRQ